VQLSAGTQVPAVVHVLPAGQQPGSLAVLLEPHTIAPSPQRETATGVLTPASLPPPMPPSLISSLLGPPQPSSVAASGNPATSSRVARPADGTGRPGVRACRFGMHRLSVTSSCVPRTGIPR